LGDEFGLNGDVLREPVAQTFHGGAIELSLELGAGGPGTVPLLCYGRGLNASLASICDELGPTFGEWSFGTLRIPDEVSYSEGGEFFAGIPGCESGNFAAGFILPDFLTDFVFLSLGELK